MHDHVGVGIGLEPDALRFEGFAQFEVIFDDAVMDDDELTIHTDMRVSIAFARLSVRRPARMSNTHMALDGTFADEPFEVLKFAYVTPQTDFRIAKYGDTRRVIAAIFEALQAAKDYRRRVTWADIANDSAHSGFLPSIHNLVAA